MVCHLGATALRCLQCMDVCKAVCGYIYLCMHVRRPKVNIRYLLQWLLHLILFTYLLFETGSHHITLVGLELTRYTRLTLNLECLFSEAWPTFSF